MDYLIYLMSVLLEALEEELEGRGRGEKKGRRRRIEGVLYNCKCM